MQSYFWHKEPLFHCTQELAHWAPTVPNQLTLIAACGGYSFLVLEESWKRIRITFKWWMKEIKETLLLSRASGFPEEWDNGSLAACPFPLYQWRQISCMTQVPSWSLLGTKCRHPLNWYIKVLVPTVVVFMGGALGGYFHLDEIMRTEPLWLIWGSCKRQSQTASPMLICQPWRKPSPEPSNTDTLILDFGLQNCEINFCHLNYPVWSILL